MNPSFDFEHRVDRTLEPDEAIHELQAKYPDLKTTTEKDEEEQVKDEFRDMLCDEHGICHERAQLMLEPM